MTRVEDVQAHMCYTCNWNGACEYVRPGLYNLYGVEEYGTVTGEDEMKAEIFARGPIACSLYSGHSSFYNYKGGIITCDDRVSPACDVTYTDHVVVIAGYGVDAETGTPFWVGRNSYGTQWGEGPGGGWFRIKRGDNLFGVEGWPCAWAVPAEDDVKRVMEQWERAVNSVVHA